MSWLLLSAFMEGQNIEFSFDVFNDPTVAPGLKVNARYAKVYLVFAATPDAASGSWGMTLTETGTKFAEMVRHAAEQGPPLFTRINFNPSMNT